MFLAYDKLSDIKQSFKIIFVAVISSSEILKTSKAIIKVLVPLLLEDSQASWATFSIHVTRTFELLERAYT